MPGALISNGAAYRIRTYDVLIRSQTLYPAEVTPQLVDYYAQGLNNGQAFFQKKLSNLIFNHLEGLARSSTHRDIRKAPSPGALKSIGAAYRIRTYDVLIRSQTLYPAEVTPQRTDYYAREPPMGQATIRKNFTE